MCPPLIAAGITAAAGIASSIGGAVATGNQQEAQRRHEREMAALQSGSGSVGGSTPSSAAAALGGQAGPPLSVGQALGQMGALGAQMGGAAAQPGVYAPGAEQVRTLSGHAPRLSPAHQQALSTLLSNQLQQPLERHQEQVGRAIVNRTTDGLRDTLHQIKERLDHRATQIQATAEHRSIEAEQAFRRELFERLSRIQSELRRATAPRRF